MTRDEMIDHLVKNLEFMNLHRIGKEPGLTRDSLDQLKIDERERFEKMSDMQLKNMVLINL